MSGRRQHFIPRHFQKAFSSHESHSSKIWLFRRGCTRAINTSIENTAVGIDFYEKPSECGLPTLDDLITDYELRITKLVNKIRKYEVGTRIPADDIAEVATHLSIRAAYIREFVAEGAKSMIGLISSLLSNPESVLGGVDIPMHVAPDIINAALTEKLEEEGLLSLTNVSAETLSRLFYFGVREDYETLRDQALEAFSTFTEALPSQFGEIGRIAHTGVLRDSIAPEKRREQLGTLSWTIESHDTGNAVLPDCVLIAMDENGWGPYIMSEKDTLECVILPIAPDRLAVGRADDAPRSPPADYNNHAVNSCFSFFLASSPSEKLERAIANLGEDVRKKVTRLTEVAGQAAVANTLRVDAAQKHTDAKDVTWELCMKSKTFSYSVRLRDFGDEELAKKIAQVVNELVTDFCGVFPARTLDGITFAIDYAAAIRDLDRGLEQHLEVMPGVYGDGAEGVALPLLVRRDDQIKTHFIARADMAMSLIGADAAAKREADAVVIHGLASAALSDLIDTKFPGILLTPHPETYDGWLSNYSDGIYSSYFTNRVVQAGYDHVKFYRKIAQDAVEALISEAREASANYRSDSDHDTYFIRCANAASNLMYALARVFGTKSVIFGPFAEDQMLHERLDALGLRKWASLFAADLERFHNNLEEWHDYSEIYFLNRHLERILFETGVLPDQLDSGNLYVHVSNKARIVELNRAYQEALH